MRMKAVLTAALMVMTMTLVLPRKVRVSPPIIETTQEDPWLMVEAAAIRTMQAEVVVATSPREVMAVWDLALILMMMMMRVAAESVERN